MDRSLRRELKSAFGFSNYWFNTVKYEDNVEIKVRSTDKVIQIIFPKKKNCSVFCKTVHFLDYFAFDIAHFNCYNFFKKSN